MFFIFSKILQFLLVPFNWILLLLILQFFVISIRVKKRLFISAVVIFLLFSNEWLYQKIMLAWQQNNTEIKPNSVFTVGIVLGGFSAFDKYDNGYFNESVDRFTQTLKLYKKGIINKIIISGGTGTLAQKEPPEANFVRKEFIENGVPDSVLFIENKSRNTFENALFSKRIIDSLKIDSPIVVITSAFHSKRAKLVFKKVGLNVAVHPAAFSVINARLPIGSYFIPSISVLAQWPQLLKEWMGIFVYRLTGKA